MNLSRYFRKIFSIYSIDIAEQVDQESVSKLEKSHRKCIFKNSRSRLIAQVTLPISNHNYALDLPEMMPRKLNWVGRLIRSIRLCEKRGWLYRSVVAIISVPILAILISLLVSLYAFKEMICQLRNFSKLRKISQDNGWFQFPVGKFNLLQALNISLPTREQITRDLRLSSQDARGKTDKELILAATLKFDNFTDRYHFDVRSSFSQAPVRLCADVNQG